MWPTCILFIVGFILKYSRQKPIFAFPLSNKGGLAQLARVSRRHSGRSAVRHPQYYGGLAQLARALAWHARGHRFDSDILHSDNQALMSIISAFFYVFFSSNLPVTSKTG